VPFAVDAAALTSRGGSPPELLAVLLGTATALLVLAAAAVLAWPLVRRRRRPAEPVAASPPNALRDALASLEAARAPAPPDERPHALDLLARALDGRGEPGLATRARMLAWARPGLDADSLDQLRAECEALLGGEEHDR